MDAPETRYARVGEDRIAYQVVGEGPVDLVYCTGTFSNADFRWTYPGMATFLRRLASFSRLILFDRRGSGLSDSLPADGVPTWEHGVEDLLAVMDAVGSDRAALCGMLDAGPMVLLAAATHPARVAAVIANTTTARWLADDDYPGNAPEAADAFLAMIEQTWGTEELTKVLAPNRSEDHDFLRWNAAYQRACATPRLVAAQYGMMLRLDVRAALPLIECPTLVIQYEEVLGLPPDHGRWLADHISGAKFLLLPGNLAAIYGPEGVILTDAVEEFLTGVKRTKSDPDRLLATVLFTDIAGSTLSAVRMGDRAWRGLLDSHDTFARERVDEFGGRLVKTTGDGMLATFDGPARAVRCGIAFVRQMQALGVGVRTGLHTGELEVRGADVGGIAVHIAARVMAEAEPGEVLVSRTVKDLVMGSDLSFADRGTRSLKGVPGDWQLAESG